MVEPRLLAVLPLLEASDPCCVRLRQRHFASVQEFAYVMDFVVHEGERAMGSEPKTSIPMRFD